MDCFGNGYKCCPDAESCTSSSGVGMACLMLSNPGLCGLNRTDCNGDGTLCCDSTNEVCDGWPGVGNPYTYCKSKWL